jgi:predicted double-glycine peptidase
MMLDVPQYYQSEDEFSCGPMAVRMVVDYYYQKEKREMTATEWLSVLNITMNNDICRKSGTKKEDIVRALSKLKFATQIIKGSDYDCKIESIRKSIKKKHPVIIYCVIKPKTRYRHFAVVVDIGDKSIYVQDPYPRKRNTKKPRKISLGFFSSLSPAIGGLSWGRSQWGIEVIKNRIEM